MKHVYVVTFEEYVRRRGTRIFGEVPTPEGLREAYLDVSVGWARDDLQAHHSRQGTSPTKEDLAACVGDVNLGLEFEFHVQGTEGDIRVVMTEYGIHVRDLRVTVERQVLR